MPEQVADVSRAHALRQQQRGATVTQIMEPNLWEPGRFQNQVKPAYHAARVHWSADGGGEHKPGFLPAGAGHRPRRASDGKERQAASPGAERRYKSRGFGGRSVIRPRGSRLPAFNSFRTRRLKSKARERGYR